MSIFPPQDIDADDMNVDGVEYGEECGGTNTMLSSSNGSFFVGDQVLDYVYRGTCFEDLSIWRYCATTETLSMSKEDERPPVRHKKRGPCVAERVRFTSDQHPLYHTHLTGKRTVPYIVMLLGPTVPRPDRSPEERELWCRAMLILFKPWRKFDDLRHGYSSWSDAFEGAEFDLYSQQTMKNINVENECKDARDRYRSERLAGTISHDLIQSGLLDRDVDEIDHLGFEQLVLSDCQLDGVDMDILTHGDRDGLSMKFNDTVVDTTVTLVLKSLESAGILNVESSEAVVQDLDNVRGTCEDDNLKVQLGIMQRLRKDRRPDMVEIESDLHGGGCHSSVIKPETFLTELQLSVHTSKINRYPLLTKDPKFISACSNRMEGVLTAMKIRGNPEQEQVLRTVCEHFYTSDEKQLLMYVGGVGGTGKSHLINAFVRFFTECGFPEMLLLGAPTGIAAVLVRGWTLHALCFLSATDIKLKDDELRMIWKFVRYLIIDEVSMVSAKMLCRTSERLSLAKAWNPTTRGKPFGGINVLFMGDF